MFFMTKIRVRAQEAKLRLQCKDGNDEVHPIRPILTHKQVLAVTALARSMTAKEWAALQVALKTPGEWKEVS